MKKSIKRYYKVLGLIIILFPLHLFSQNTTLVRGTITDAQSEVLPFVTIIERNVENRTISSAIADMDGNFSINMNDPTNNVLVFKYVGFKDKEVRVGENRVLKIVLDDEETVLQDVVVTARARQNLGGLSIEERDISMAIGRLSADEISEVHAASIDDALQGRIAGVDIVGSTGNPGGGMAIRVRGLSSIHGDNQPLIVVDGIPMETVVGASAGTFDYSTATEEEFSQMLNIPPSDIQDIAVLKDAAASAIYGSRGADGVIVITTKRGTVSPPRINFRSTFTMDKPIESIPRLSGYEYSTLISESMFNAGTILNVAQYPEFAYDPNNLSTFYNYSQNTDWVKALEQDGYTQDYTLSLSGGSRKVRYRFSAGYWDQQGITIGTGYQRLNTRTNLDYFVSDKLRFSADIAYTHSDTKRNFIPESNNNTSGDLRDKAYIKMPNQSIYYYNDFGEMTSLFFAPESNLQGTYPGAYNPVAMALHSKNTVRNDNSRPKFSLIYDPNIEWQFKFDIAFEISNNKVEKYLPQTATGLPWNNYRTNFASDTDDDSFVIQTFSDARWMPKALNNDNHRLISLLRFATYDRKSNTYNASTGNLPSPVLQDPAINSRLYGAGGISSPMGRQRSISTVLNVNYTYLDRYIIYGSLRMDGDSKFGPNYRFGVFPAISGRYRISGEPFMKDIEWIDDLSVRGSWGVVGKTPKYDYMYFSKYSNYSYNYLGKTATYPTNIALDNLRWEKSIQQNIALNFVAFDYRLNLEFDLYKKTTIDGISDTGIPSSSGLSRTTMNQNTVENIGWELNVQTTPFQSKDWQVRFDFNVARSQNFLRKLSQYAVTESGSWDNNGQYLIRLELNQPYGSFYGYKYDGVYLNKEQTIAKDRNGNPIYTMGDTGMMEAVYTMFGYPSIGYEFMAGDARYVDINNDGNINLQDIVYLGDYNPLFYGGFGPKLKYKNLSIDSWFYFRYGNDIINMTRMNMEKMYDFNNQSTATLKRFREPYEVGQEDKAPEDLLPRALFRSGYNWLASDRFVEDGSFLKWKTLTVRYNIPRQFTSQFKVADLFVWLTMQNMLTFTNYTGQDPEVSITGGLNRVGRDYSQAPRPRQYTFGLSITL